MKSFLSSCCLVFTKDFPDLTKSWLIQSFREQCATCFIHLEEYAWSVWLVTQGSTVYRHPQLDGNVFLSRRKYSRNWTITPSVLPFHMKLIEQKWTAHTFPDTPGAVVSSPSGSSVESSWEIHVASLLRILLDINEEVQLFSFLLYNRGQLFLFFCFSFHFPTLFMAINCIILVFEMNVDMG